MSAGSKERQKLTASWLNTLAAGSITAGVITPIIALQTGILKNVPEEEFISGSAMWFAVGIFLHIFALVSLTGLEE